MARATVDLHPSLPPAPHDPVTLEDPALGATILKCHFPAVTPALGVPWAYLRSGYTAPRRVVDPFGERLLASPSAALLSPGRRPC